MVHNISLLLFVFVVFLMPSDCNGQEVRIVRSNDLVERDGLKYEVNSKTPFTGKSPFTGKAVTFHENGQKKSEVNYKDGKVDGLSTAWYESGQKQAELTVKDGVPDGLFTVWYEHGQKKSEIDYKNGVEDGRFIEWYESGQKRSEATNEDGGLVGRFTTWYENGQKQSEGSFKDGIPETSTNWARNGNVIKEKHLSGIQLWNGVEVILKIITNFRRSPKKELLEER